MNKFFHRVSESLKRIAISRLVLSVYMAGGLALWSFLVTYINPKIYEKIENVRRSYERVGQVPPTELVYIPGGFTPPDYPMGFYICAISLIVVPLVYFAPTIARRIGIVDSPMYRCVFLVVLFSIIGGLTLLNFGSLIGYLIVLVAYGLLFGLIDAVQLCKLDFSYISDMEIPRETRLAKLQMEHDRWFRGLTLFSGFLVAGVVAGGIQYIIAAPPTIATEQAATFIFVAVYPGIGLGIWLYWDVIKKVNSVSENILKVR